MDVTTTEWLITVGVTIAVLLFDIVIVARRPHEPTLKECAIALSFYVGSALLFGLWILSFHGHDHGIEFYTGWLVEYSLSIDNLFLFIIIMASLNVPRKYQQEALMVGIILALIFRAIFIALGKVAIDNFSWVFYAFGALLIYTAYSMVKSHRRHDDETRKENRLVTLSRKHLNATDEYHGLKLYIKRDGARTITPMFIVILALGSTDIMFALDSIPAIYGITQEPYLVFTANVFALMGLRQLYFLLGDLLQKLVYLSLGLSFILAFIGVKLVLHALHKNELPFINDGNHLPVPEINSLMSLSVVIVTLAVTAIASLAKSRSQVGARQD